MSQGIPPTQANDRQRRLQTLLFTLGGALQGQQPLTSFQQIQGLQQQAQQQAQLDQAIQNLDVPQQQKDLLRALPNEQKIQYLAAPKTNELTNAIRDYEYYQGLSPKQQVQFSLATGRTSPMVLEAERAARSPGGLDLTTAEEEIDKKFAKENLEWERGGKPNMEEEISTLKSIIRRMDFENVSGPFMGSLPRPLRAISFPKAVDLEDQISGVVFKGLRNALGAQFTEKEGQRFVAAVFNVLLPEEQNQVRLGRLLAKTEATFLQREEQSQYFKEKGTLKGYEAPEYNFKNFLNDILFPEFEGLSDEQLIEQYRQSQNVDYRQSILDFAEQREAQSKALQGSD